MTSSARKKKEKKKDFQRAKLKVGKAKPKASNHTDTSFKSKAIVLAEQSLKQEAPSSTSQFDHHVSSLSARSDTQRKESLSYLTTAVSSHSSNETLPQPLGVLLPKLLPLMLDGSNGVRTQLLKLLQALPQQDMPRYAEKIALYLRAGMTHLAVDIRHSALAFFDWTIKACGTELVECPGGWLKTLKTFLTVLGWSTNNATSGWSTNLTLASNDKITAKILNTLAAFLELGLIEKEVEGPSEADLGRAYFPLTHTWLHMIPKKSNPYGYLDLFGPPRDEESTSYIDVESRQEKFSQKYQEAFEKGLENAKRAGGEIGRAGAKTAKVIVEGMKGFSGDD